MVQLNYYSHLLLTSKYSFLIKLLVIFLSYNLLGMYLNLQQIIECTIEHPANIQRTTPIADFAPASNFRAQPIVNIVNIQNENDLRHYLTLSSNVLAEYRTEHLEIWYRNLTTDITQIGYRPSQWNGDPTQPFKYTIFAIQVNELNFFLDTTAASNIHTENNPQLILNRARNTVRQILIDRRDNSIFSNYDVDRITAQIIRRR